MALNGLGLASGLLATGARLGHGLSCLRLGLRLRCRLGFNNGCLDLLDLGRRRLRLRLGGGYRFGLRLDDGLGRVYRGNNDGFRLGEGLGDRLALRFSQNSLLGHTFHALLRGGLGITIGALQQGFLRVEGLLTLLALHGNPGAVARETASLYVVAQLHAHVLVHQGAAGGVEHGEGDLHAVLGVTRHHVGGAQVDHVRVHAKGVNAGVFQKASDNGTDMHVLGLTRDSGLEARDAADDHVHADSSARCLGNLVDDLAVGERVEFKEHTGGLAGKGALNLAVQTAHDERLKADGRHAQEAVIAAQVAQ